MINSVIGLLTILYPFAVYFGMHYLEPWKIASVLFILLGIRLIASEYYQHADELKLVHDWIVSPDKLHPLFVMETKR